MFNLKLNLHLYSNLNLIMSPRKSKLPLILGAIVVVLLCYNAYLLMEKFKNDKAKAAFAEQAVELEESKTLAAELEVNYNATIAKLDEAAAGNSELAALVEKQKAELSKSKGKIQRLINENKGTEDELVEVRRMLASFYTQRDSFLAEIAVLKQKNAKLEAQKKVLKEEKAILKEVVDEQRVIEESLRVDKTELQVEKADLVVVNRSLKEQKEEFRNMASVLKTNKVKVQSVKIRNNGEEKTVRSGKRADRIKVCFELLENTVAKPGPQTILLRIINPAGETIAIEDQGSGTFEDKQNGGETRYTASEVITYENAPTDMCMYWNDEKGFDKGEYTTELYHKGYMIGREKIVLK